MSVLLLILRLLVAIALAFIAGKLVSKLKTAVHSGLADCRYDFRTACCFPSQPGTFGRRMVSKRHPRSGVCCRLDDRHRACLEENQKIRPFDYHYHADPVARHLSDCIVDVWDCVLDYGYPAVPGVPVRRYCAGYCSRPCPFHCAGVQDQRACHVDVDSHGCAG